MKSIEFFPWVYDIKIDSKGIIFVIFHFWTIYLLSFENIKSVNEISYLSRGSWSAYNFKNRFLSRSFILELHHGWFARKVLVTPKEPADFLAHLRANGIV